MRQQKKPLQQREKELQTLLATPEGKVQLEDLAARYAQESNKVRPVKTSLVTFILVHERRNGLIAE
jgi:hypothetical protein